MINPIDKLKHVKGRTWTELRSRGEQFFSAYTEQIGLSGKLPTDDEMNQLIENSSLGNTNSTPEFLYQKFYKVSQTKFFPSFRQKDKTVELFRKSNRDAVINIFEKADKITQGKFDLLGYQNLDLGLAFDWHYDPISGKHLPLKHWKQYDDLETEQAVDKTIIFELNRHQHFFTLGVAYLLSKDEIFAKVFVEHLESWMEQNPPGMGINWVRSLEVSMRAMSWIWAFQFFQNSQHFTAAVFHKALKFLHVHGRHLEKYLSTYCSPNTELIGEALGLYYLGTQLPFFKRAEHWRKLGESILFSELDRQILADGGHFEQSTWYQRFTTDSYLQFLILKTLNDDETPDNLAEKLEVKVQKQLDFLMYVTRPDGTTPIIGDDDGGRSLPLGNRVNNDFRSLLSTGAVLFERGDYKYVAQKFHEETLWLLGFEGVQSFKTIREYYPEKCSESFLNSGYFVMRDGWSNSDNYMLIDCGDLKGLSGKHSHADTLSIDLAIGGKTLLVDPGTYTFHESQNLRDYFRSTMAHNTLSINNESSSELGGKYSWKTMAKADPQFWISQDRFDFFEGAHRGYKKSPHARSILFLKNDYWIMRDYVETVAEQEYQLNFHFNSKTNPVIESDENGTWGVEELSDKSAGLKLFTFGDNGGWQRKDSWISDCYGRRVNAPFLRFISKGSGSQEFFTFIVPVESSSKKPEVFETEISGARAFVINCRGYRDIFVFSDSNQIVRTELFDSDFRFLWARLSLDNELPDEFVMIDGKTFVINGREIINYPQNLKFATARRLGNRLNVRTNESLFSVSLPQNRPHPTILKDALESE